MRHRIRLVSLFVAAALIAAACGGGESSSGDETVTDTSAPATTTTPPLPTTSTTTSTTTLPTTTTTEAATGEVAPLTGLPVQAPITRPAIVAKIDNHQAARPQWGLNGADVVFEELVEGNITRFAAVFHSTDSDPIGPVRSARTGDYELLTNLNTPIFANSGGNPTVMNGLRSVDTVLLSDANVGSAAYYRNNERRAPHNLLTDTRTLWELAEDMGGSPPAMFTFRAEGTELPAEAVPVKGVRVDYGGYRIDYLWDEAAAGWMRVQQGATHIDADGATIAPENVIVQFVNYGQSIADPASPEVRVIGTGDAWVFTNGAVIRGTWTRASSDDVTVYEDGDGNPIELTPGRTWIALPRPERASLLLS